MFDTYVLNPVDSPGDQAFDPGMARSGSTSEVKREEGQPNWREL